MALEVIDSTLRALFKQSPVSGSMFTLSPAKDPLPGLNKGFQYANGIH